MHQEKGTTSARTKSRCLMSLLLLLGMACATLYCNIPLGTVMVTPQEEGATLQSTSLTSQQPVGLNPSNQQAPTASANGQVVSADHTIGQHMPLTGGVCFTATTWSECCNLMDTRPQFLDSPCVPAARGTKFGDFMGSYGSRCEPRLFLDRLPERWTNASTCSNSKLEQQQRSSASSHAVGSPNQDVLPVTEKDAAGAQPVAVSSHLPQSDIFTPDIPVSLDILSICARYGYEPREPLPTQRPARRLFLGGLIADDSLETLRASAAEGKNLYHTVVYVEANSTQAKFPRALRFTVGSKNLEQLQKYWDRTTVVVKYVTDLPAVRTSSLLREHLQRQHVLPGWQGAGMQPIDVGVIADADEAWTRDYLLAAMHCEIPELITGPAQSCKKPKILASTLNFESSPECIPQKRIGYHPDMMIGECIESIGDPSLHKPMPRSYTQPDNPNQLYRSAGLQVGYGGGNDWSLFDPGNNKTHFPLWTAGDFRQRAGGVQISMSKNTESQYGWQAANYNGQPVRITAYHFHNWFQNAEIQISELWPPGPTRDDDASGHA